MRREASSVVARSQSTKLKVRTGSLISNCDLRLFSSTSFVAGQQNKKCYRAGTKIYNFGRGDRIDLSLSSRRAAELEDKLLSWFDSDNTEDPRLLDPLLGKAITRKDLDWIRSISFTSSLSFEHERDASEKETQSFVISVQPPTLLHPHLHLLASNLAQVLQERTASLLSNDQQSQQLDPQAIPVEIRIQSQSTRRHSKPSMKTPQTTTQSLQGIKHFLAVYSCKGGVGKSTIATNLAYQLASMGGRVGLLDLDVYGPSLPLLVKPRDKTVRKSPPEMGEGMVDPIEHKGVKLMSLGYVSPNSGVPGSGSNGGAAVLRGPMAGRVVSQLLKKTNWGELDLLILDMPPGTGDIQLEVCQSLSLSGAVAVSTPSALAWADVVKGVQMFGDMGVSTLALVENMSYFECEGGGRHYPLGKSKSLKDIISAPGLSEFMPSQSHVFYLPISTTLNDRNDSGTPLCCDKPHDAENELAAFSKIADAVSVDLLRIEHGLTPLSVDAHIRNQKSVLTVVLDEAGELDFDVPLTQLSVDNETKHLIVRLFGNDGGYQKAIHGSDLKRRDPKTGDEFELLEDMHKDHMHLESSRIMVEHHSACDNLFPATVIRKGNYGYEVRWADGAKVIYSLLAITKAAGGSTK